MSAVESSVVLAMSTLDSAFVFDTVRQRAAMGRAIFLVVPVRTTLRGERDGLDSEHARWSHEHPAVTTARWHLRHILQTWRRAGIEVQGEVGAADPVRAVGDVVGRIGPGEVIVSRMPGRPTPWLRRDLPRRLQQVLDIPVIVIEPSAKPEATRPTGGASSRGTRALVSRR